MGQQLDAASKRIAEEVRLALEDKLNDIQTAVGASTAVLSDLLERNEECRLKLMMLESEMADIRHSYINLETALKQWQDIAKRRDRRIEELKEALGDQQIETGRLQKLKGKNERL